MHKCLPEVRPSKMRYHRLACRASALRDLVHTPAGKFGARKSGTNVGLNVRFGSKADILQRNAMSAKCEKQTTHLTIRKQKKAPAMYAGALDSQVSRGRRRERARTIVN